MESKPSEFIGSEQMDGGRPEKHDMSIWTLSNGGVPATIGTRQAVIAQHSWQMHIPLAAFSLMALFDFQEFQE